MELKFENLSIGVVGDIHGDFSLLQTKLHGIIDSVLVVAGDCGFGFEPFDKILKMRKKLWDEFLLKRNLYVLFLRGNHDNPKWFESSLSNKLNTERFKLIPDYTTIAINNKLILCIGGAVSIDRKYRKYEKTIWHGEELQLIYPLPDYKPDIIIAHTIQPEILGFNKLAIYSFDDDLTEDLKEEHAKVKTLLDHYKPNQWIHGHYHISCRSMYNNTSIVSLDCNEIYQIR